ncbi:MAG: InlB B-repeat-containing protein, partial [Treponema sp.]|nr:InlB B-repeat-containing protein [Treponema sp.]
LTSAKTYTLLQKDLNLTYTISYLVYNKTTQAWEEFIYNETTQALEKFMPDGYYQIAATTTLATPSSRDDYYFKGWYELPEDAAEAAVSGSAVTKIPLGNTGNKTFYAKWIPKTLSGYSLEDALAMISANPEDGDDYTIVLNNDELVAIAPTELSYGGKTVSITLEGGAKERILSLSEPGSLFTLGDGVTLSLGSNITLQGRSDNTASLVTVDSGAELVINPGSKIRDNSSTTNGGGVSVGSGGEVTMNGGEISGNKALNSSGRGGGVYIDGGKFTLNEGAISGNSTPNSGTGASSGGGGVFVTNSGTFEMTGGEVSKNSSRTDGGGVFIKYGTFKMSGGVISGNSAQYGGAMYLSGGTITKASGGVIYGSDAESTLRNTGNGSVAYGRRNSTVEEGETLDSTKSGAEGGWVDRWTVTFNADGGVLVTQTVRVDTSTSLGASMPSDPTRDGYAFGGWYTAQNGGGTQFTETTPVTKHVTVYAFWLASASAQIDLRPVPDDPALSATTLLVSEEAAFSAEAGYASYQWYWDGIAISGATSPSYTLAANAELPGVYELSVVVATAAAPDEKLSARCQVTITAG